MTPGPAGRRPRLAPSEVAAWSLVVLIIVLTAADLPLGVATRWAGSGIGANLGVFLALLPVVLVGFVVARRQPGNPLGWMLLALATLGVLSGVGADYAWFSYQLGHHLPLAAVGVLFGPY